MKKIYLVDSENVGDIWVPLLASSQPEDEVIVFYTQKSPHMNYENVRILKETEKEAAFIKCFEGSNALDFQLVSELGYRLCEDGESDFIIVTNDTGFDAVVRYWSARERSVSRLSGKECHRMVQEKRRKGARTGRNTAADDELVNEQPQEIRTEQSEPISEAQGIEDKVQQAHEEEVSLEETTAVSSEDAVEPQTDTSDAQPEEAPDVRVEVIKTLCCCISRENLVDFHNALVAFLGEDDGKALYQEIKGSTEYGEYWSSIPKNSQKEKFEIYCGLVFDYGEPREEKPEDFADFLYRAGSKRKNLNSLRAALQGHYGKDKGMRYYSLFKSHIKIMNRM